MNRHIRITDITPHPDRAGRLAIPDNPSLGTLLKIWFRQRKLAFSSHDPKIGMMFSSQRFAMFAGIEPLKAEFCQGCGRVRPHTFWPGGRHLCMLCLHMSKSVDFLLCHSCGPGYHARQSDGNFRCYACWLDEARKQLEGVKERKVLPIRRPLNIVMISR